jgi:small-conductance mechanosensitive channel
MTVWDRHNDEFTAAITLVVTLVIAGLLGRLMSRRLGGGLQPGVETRVRLFRRLAVATVLVIGVALALSRFEGIRQLATGVLASTAVLGLVVGFAARQTLANAVAGVLLAVTQPLRIGDYIRFQDATGLVDDMTLTYTFIDTLDGGRMIVPNEMLVTAVLHNRSLVGPTSVVVSAWLPKGADVTAARRALEPLEAEEIRVAELTDSGVRIEVGSGPVPGPERRRRESELRERVLARLGEAGLLGEA